MKRVLTGLLLVAPVVYVVFAGHPALFLAVAAAVAMLCWREYRHLVAAHGIDSNGPLGYAAGLVVLLAPRESWLILTLLAMLVLSLATRNGHLPNVLPRAGAVVLGLLYIFGPWKCAVGLRAISPHWLFFTLALNWAGDVAAYYVGSAIGRHKLAPRVSPSKSWEGAVASLLASVLFGFFYLRRFIPSMPLVEALLLSGAANVAGQVGDLVESSLKRGAGVKDSGGLLPGHGGLLDRVDSSLFALPTVYFWLLRPWQS